MHRALIEAESLLGEELTNLRLASERTDERRASAATAIDAFIDEKLGSDRQGHGEPLITAFGSMAREEMGPGSDFDYLVILNAVETDPARIVLYRRAAVEGLKAISAKEPGASGLFGTAVSGVDLVNTIGLDGDSNLHLSRRVLLLEESIPLNAHDQWDMLLEGVCARYLHEQTRTGPWVPRFLLSDVVRYWRTISVDYQAKRWEELASAKWGERYAKLITSRKWTFAGMIASLIVPVVAGVEPSTTMLREQFTMPALARLAQLCPYIGDDSRAHLVEVLRCADQVVAWLADADMRDELKKVVDPRTAPRDSAIGTLIAIGETIQSSLEGLFFSNEPLRDQPANSLGALTRRYLVF